MKNLGKILFFIINFAIFLTLESTSQSAVAYCEKTGAIGYAFNAKDQAEAIRIALEKCLEDGGVACSIISSTSESGYGAIAIDNESSSKRLIGVSLGQNSKEEAEQKAMDNCKNNGALRPKIFLRWSEKK